MTMRSIVFAALVLLACAPAAPVSTPVASEADAAMLGRRVAAATQSREAIQAAIQHEDGPRKGKPKTVLVGDQVRATLDEAARLVPAAPLDEAKVRAYEQACAALEAAYLESLLESTDPASKPLPWMSDEGRDVLGSPTVDAKLAAWQAFDAEHPFAKFAVVRVDGVLQLRVGRLDVGHVDIAGAPALSAGLLRSEVQGGRTVIVVVENTSGGFRPGPLRNRTTLGAIEAVGYLPSDRAALTVHDNPSGGYADSVLIRPRNR
jgi:hypothetical protein